MLGWELPPHNSGGLGVACYHLSRALAQAGASIDFVVPYEADHSSIDFMRIHGAVPVGVRENYGMQAYDHDMKMTKELPPITEGAPMTMRQVQHRYIRYVDHLIETISPDVIHAHDWLTMEAGVRAKRKTGVPLVVHVHATEFDRSGERSGNPIVHEIEQEALMEADRIIAVSNITKAIIVQNYHIPADKIEVVHNAVDVASLISDEYDRRTYGYLELLKSEGYTVIATVTRFTVQKGLTHLVRAAARASERYDKLVFLFAGDGEQRDELIMLAAEFGIADKVFFTGFVRGKQWRDAYAVADVFVMSSVSEPFGLTALEAAHHGSALIISKQSGVGEVLHAIFRYDFWDTDRLADQMVALATSDSLMHELKQGVAQEYARLTWRDVAEKCQLLYRHTQQGALTT